MEISRTAVALSAALLVAATLLVALSLRREPPVTFAPTPLAPAEVGEALVGPVRVTLDAGDPARWVFFDFSRGSTVEDPDPDGWDLAFRRFHVAVNGGPGLAGGGARDLGEVALESLDTVPRAGYHASEARRDSANPAIARWYDYGFTSHLLTPRPRTYAVRTADARYAAIRFRSYYCPGPTPGCVTFDYVYQGDGTNRVRGAAPADRSP